MNLRTMPKAAAMAAMMLLTSGLEARNVFFFPADTTNRNVQVFSQEPFNSLGGFVGATSIFDAFVLPNGSKYYFVSRSASDTIVVVDGAFGSVLRRIDLGVNAEAAAMTPDGSKLLVLAGRLYIFNTATDQELTPLQPLDLGTNPNRIVVNHESTRAFVLSQNRLTAVDLISSSVISPALGIPGSPTDVATTPQDTIIVTAQNRFYLIDGRTMTFLGSADGVPVNARPRSLQVTPDGRFAIAVNDTPITGSPVAILDIAARIATLPPVTAPVANALDRVVVTGNDRAYGVTQGRQLVIINIVAFSMTVTNYPGVGQINSVTALAASKEIPSRFLFVSTPSSIYRIDPQTNQIVGTVSPTLAVGNMAAVGPPGTVNPSTVQQFNSSQTIGAGGASQPLILRALGGLGEPLYNVEATITNVTQGVTFQQGNARTNANGFALFQVVAPPQAGTYVVTINIGAITINFTITVTGATTPGVGGASIVSGNGQAVREQFLTLEPMTILLTGTDGRPLVSSPVSWEVTQGAGTLVQAVTLTDNEGKASTNFLATNVPGGLSYSTATVTATTVAGPVNFVVTTLVSTLLGGGLATQPAVEIQAPTLVDPVIRGRAGERVPGGLRILVVAASGGQAGQPIPNIGVRISTGNAPGAGPTASCNGPGGIVLTGQDGIANCEVVFGARTGVAALNINVGNFVEFNGLYTISVDFGLPAVAQIVQGNNQAGIAGQRLERTFVARITDGADNILSGVGVVWEVSTANSATLTNVITTSDINGLVSAGALLGTTGGTFQVRVRSTTGTASAVFTFTVTIPVNAISRVSGDGQSVLVTQTFPQPLVVRVTNSQGVGVNAVRVDFAVTGGSASVNPPSALTDNNGQASTVVTAGPNAGTILVSAQAGNFATVFTLTSRPPQPVFSATSIFNAASFATGFVSPCGLYEIVAQNIATDLQGIVFGANPLLPAPLPFRLRGIQVIVSGAESPIHSVRNIAGRESVVVQIPCETQGPFASVQLTSNNLSTTVNVPVLAAQPGVFETTLPDNTRLPVLFRSNGTFVADDNPAIRGEQVTMVVNALGQTNNPRAVTNRIGVPGQTVAIPLLAGVNDQGVRIVSAVAGPLPGIYFVTIEIPANTAPGRRVNLGLAAILPDNTTLFANGSAFPLN
jgi:hypothetical protein